MSQSANALHRLSNLSENTRDLLFNGALLSSVEVSTPQGTLLSRLFRNDQGGCMGARHLKSNRANVADSHVAAQFATCDEYDMECFFGSAISFTLFKSAGFTQFEYIGTGQFSGVYHDPIMEQEDV